MSHSIKLLIKSKDFKIISEIEDMINKRKGGLEQYKLTRGMFSYSCSNMHPFLYFPENKEDIDEEGYYLIQVESGNHCAIYDTPYSTYMAMFYHILLHEIDSSCIENIEYEIWDENDDTTYKGMREFWKAILENDLFLKQTKANTKTKQ